MPGGFNMISVASLIKHLPEGYARACYEKKAMVRKRGIASPDDLMMLALFHLLNGCSLVEVSEVARITKLGEFSDVAFMKRFENCGDWFKWIAGKLQNSGMADYAKPNWMGKFRVVAVDASDVVEKGRSGRTYRLHFAIDIFSMGSLQYKITSQDVGETLRNFNFEKNDLVMADRAYSTINGVKHCISSGGQFIMRLRKNCFKLYDAGGKAIDLLSTTRNLGDGEIADVEAYTAADERERIPLRVCIKRKPPEAVEQIHKKLKRKESKKQYAMAPDTVEFNEYFVVLTSLGGGISAAEILEAYRYRWQVEMHFKRLKSILDFGDLPKRRPDSVFSWLNGKLMVALLIEKVLSEVDFSPTRQECEPKKLMA
jgi:hypothetical protein